MAGRLEGKVAVVTGSGSGIGQAIAERLAQEGANLVVDYRDHIDQAQATVQKIESAGGKAVLVQADVTKLPDGVNLIEQAWQQLGSCDILVNNAGIEKGADFTSTSPKPTTTPSSNVNLKGAYFLTQAFVRKLKGAAKKPGRIINISSVHEDMVFPHFTTYCLLSKGGMRMLMRNLSRRARPTRHHRQQHRSGSHRHAHQRKNDGR